MQESRKTRAEPVAELAALRRRVRELETSEDNFRLLAEGVEDYGVFMLDPDGRMAMWNAG